MKGIPSVEVDLGNLFDMRLPTPENPLQVKYETNQQLCGEIDSSLTLLDGGALPDFMQFDHGTMTLHLNATEESHVGLYQLQLYCGLLEYPEAFVEKDFDVVINNSTSDNTTVEADNNSTTSNQTLNATETSDSQAALDVIVVSGEQQHTIAVEKPKLVLNFIIASVNETGSMYVRFSHPVIVPYIWQNVSEHGLNETETNMIMEVLELNILSALDIDEDLYQIGFFNLTNFTTAGMTI